MTPAGGSERPRLFPKCSLDVSSARPRRGSEPFPTTLRAAFGDGTHGDRGCGGQTGGMGLAVPRNLADHAQCRGRVEWIAALPTVIEELQDLWSLEIGEPFQPGGQTAWVAPATSSEFREIVLKVACRHYEAFDEAKGLREWDGEGTVRLLAAEDVNEATTALLLERCRPGTPLSAFPDMTQDAVISGLLRRLWKPPPFAEEFRPLQQMCDRWADECEQKLAENPARRDVGLLHEGIALFRSLPASAERRVLVCTDLHADNVLAAEREPWLVIDPKPYVGDPTYDALQHLLNCEDRLIADPAALVATIAHLCDLDPGRLGRWLFARCAVEAPDWPELLDVARQLAANLGL